MSAGTPRWRSEDPKKHVEPRTLPKESFELLDWISTRVRPDVPDLEEWCSTYCRQHRRRFAADLEIVNRHVGAGERILEYGAVPLVVTGALATQGYQVSAVDIAPERFATTIAELGLDVAACDIEREDVPFESESFDAVLFNELFEHLRIDPIFTLREAYRILKPGGVLLLSTPNLRSFRGLRNLLIHNRGHAVSAGVYRQYEKLQRLGHMGHVREYTSRDVADFLRRIGFVVEAVIYRGGYGKGLVGFAERLAPGFCPFFSLVARRPISDRRAGAEGSAPGRAADAEGSSS